MPDKGLKIEDFDRVLVVEGYGDLLFYAEVLEELGLEKRVFIKHLGGNTRLSTILETFITPDLLNSKTNLGFIFDADDRPQATRDKLQGLLTKLTGQTVVDGNWTTSTPKVVLFIVPGGDRTGEIETLVWNSWASDPANAHQKQCILDYIACMKTAGKTAHSPDKGLISALLAIQSDEDPRLGPGARDNVFDLTRPELAPLRTFLSGFQIPGQA